MKPRQFASSYIVDIAAALLLLLFMYAALTKLLDFQKFRVQLGQSPILVPVAGLVSWMIPSLEILIALMLGFEKFRLAGLQASLALMTTFSVYIFVITRFSSYIPCSCGGILEGMGWGQHLIFNLCFLILSLAGIVMSKPKQNDLLQ